MIRITTLVENSMGEHLGLRSEHGLSFCVETTESMLLFDTGQSDAVIHNASQLRIDVSRLDHVVLSHGHYDHSGGLRSIAEHAHHFTLVTGKGFFTEKYAERNGSHQFLGNNFDEAYLNDKGIPWSVLENQVKEIVPGVFVVGNFPRVHSDEPINPRFKLLSEGAFVPDLFNDEIMLVLDTPKGLVALLGCSHPGMRNMLETVKKAFNKPVYALLGGTHLVESASEGMQASLAYLHETIKGPIGVSHCTGKAAMGVLAVSEGRYFTNSTGTSLFID
jgi:7,8-dihydropterin-6-yl-methyl-4-(beta-D-ribofuranosyl)aminobenzene 5'-phosphate synthase